MFVKKHPLHARMTRPEFYYDKEVAKFPERFSHPLPLLTPPFLFTAKYISFQEISKEANSDK